MDPLPPRPKPIVKKPAQPEQVDLGFNPPPAPPGFGQPRPPGSVNPKPYGKGGKIRRRKTTKRRRTGRRRRTRRHR